MLGFVSNRIEWDIDCTRWGDSMSMNGVNHELGLSMPILDSRLTFHRMYSRWNITPSSCTIQHPTLDGHPSYIECYSYILVVPRSRYVRHLIWYMRFGYSIQFPMLWYCIHVFVSTFLDISLTFVILVIRVVFPLFLGLLPTL